jgi:predicted lipid-binding transport protein (Tim44 family)
MSKFLSKIQEKLDVLNEQEPAPPEDPAMDPAAADPNAAPPPPETETPESELPDQGDDDTAKMKVDYVEMIRKALIMAPKHIDDVDYAKLTKIVDTENLEEMQELVSRIVRNNYPHPDL